MLDREDLISPRRMRRFFDRYYMTGPREEEWRYWGELSTPNCGNCLMVDNEFCGLFW